MANPLAIPFIWVVAKLDIGLFDQITDSCIDQAAQVGSDAVVTDTPVSLNIFSNIDYKNPVLRAR